jgi:hypothetical protein
MAKSDSFFIRAKVTYGDDSAYAQTEIDLGSFVNLGVSKSTLLRIHNIQVGYRESEGVFQPSPTGAGVVANVAWQLTTQTQSAIVGLDDKSVCASGGLVASCDAQSGGVIQYMDDVTDINPSSFTNGYLVGTDSMFLGIDGDANWVSGFDLAILMECTLENATQANSIALALSQQ